LSFSSDYPPLKKLKIKKSAPTLIIICDGSLYKFIKESKAIIVSCTQKANLHFTKENQLYGWKLIKNQSNPYDSQQKKKKKKKKKNYLNF
jgi:hypothetical protein